MGTIGCRYEGIFTSRALSTGCSTWEDCARQENSSCPAKALPAQIADYRYEYCQEDQRPQGKSRRTLEDRSHQLVPSRTINEANGDQEWKGIPQAVGSGEQE